MYIGKSGAVAIAGSTYPGASAARNVCGPMILAILNATDINEHPETLIMLASFTQHNSSRRMKYPHRIILIVRPRPRKD